jgi:hypothetical protein
MDDSVILPLPTREHGELLLRQSNSGRDLKTQRLAHRFSFCCNRQLQNYWESTTWDNEALISIKVEETPLSTQVMKQVEGPFAELQDGRIQKEDAEDRARGGVK